ncbi:hypothetical protein AB4308_07835 [Vibrio breoganii]
MKTITKLTICYGFLVVPTQSHACVVETTLITNLRAAGIAASTVWDAKIHETIAECNNSSERKAIDTTTNVLKIDNFWDDQMQSFTFSCKVPTYCRPSDRSEVDPFTIVYSKSHYKNEVSIQELLNYVRNPS